MMFARIHEMRELQELLCDFMTRQKGEGGGHGKLMPVMEIRGHPYGLVNI